MKVLQVSNDISIWNVIFQYENVFKKKKAKSSNF